MEEIDLNIALVLISNDFGHDDDFLAAMGGPARSLDELRARLAVAIGWLLDNDFNKLLNALYRIDVPEELFRHALDQSQNVAESLAEIVISRQLKKIETRKKYK